MIRGRKFRLSAKAVVDARGILDYTLRQFGLAQQSSYAALLAEAARLVAEEPERVNSINRGQLQAGLRSFAVWIAAGRRSGASHLLFYRREGQGVLILRILHDGADAARHFGGPEVP